MSKKCSINGCDKVAKTAGLCQMHYARLRRHGDVGPADTFIIDIRKNYLSEYYSYNAMYTRCTNKKHRQYKDYGGRGIKICDRWLEKPGGIKNFIQDMGKRPDGCSLDRIDVNGDYCPENCRWADRKTQQYNRRKILKVVYMGEETPLTELARKKGLSVKVLYNRIMKYHWSINKAVSAPIRPRRTKK